MTKHTTVCVLTGHVVVTVQTTYHSQSCQTLWNVRNLLGVKRAKYDYRFNIQHTEI